MDGVLTAPRTILLELHTLRIIGLVLVCSIVPALALCAGEGNQCAHETSCEPSATRLEVACGGKRYQD